MTNNIHKTELLPVTTLNQQHVEKGGGVSVIPVRCVNLTTNCIY